MKHLLIDVLALGAILSSILVITSKNPVVAVIFLISVFCNVAGYLILLGVGFIGITYIILYVGAIAVLFLFIIMMINIKLTDILETGSTYTQNLPLGLAVGSIFIYLMFTIIPFSINDISVVSNVLSIFININQFIFNSEISSLSTINITYNPAIADTTITQFLQIESIGQGIYTYGAMLLILCSMILLLSMIAPIFISRKNI
jgi:NADH-ubiquinone oxidoreductase chain 6